MKGPGLCKRLLRTLLQKEMRGYGGRRMIWKGAALQVQTVGEEEEEEEEEQKSEGAMKTKKKKVRTPKGYVPVVVMSEEMQVMNMCENITHEASICASSPHTTHNGPIHRLYLLKAQALNWPCIAHLLEHTAQHCGYSSMGALRILCPFDTFESILTTSPPHSSPPPSPLNHMGIIRGWDHELL